MKKLSWPVFLFFLASPVTKRAASALNSYLSRMARRMARLASVVRDSELHTVSELVFS